MLKEKEEKSGLMKDIAGEIYSLTIVTVKRKYGDRQERLLCSQPVLVAKKAEKKQPELFVSK
jgi:hypothetical protein